MKNTKKSPKARPAEPELETDAHRDAKEQRTSIEAIQATVLAGRLLGKGIVVECKSKETDALVTIAFDAAHAPELPIGEEADVAFARGAAGAGFEVSGVVAGRSEDFRGVLYLVVFPGAANRALSPLVNRRGALRIGTDPEAPLLAQLQALDGEIQLELEATDISATGISLRLTLAEERTLTAARLVELSLNFPGDPIPRKISGEILRRRLIDGEVHYGIRFDERGNVGEREAILQWVLARHRAELMKAREADRQPPTK